MTKTFDFQEQLKVGTRGEELFLEYYPEPIKIWPERDGDFITQSGQKIELKTDSYNMAKTENFFIERFSDFDKKSPGSIWQAHQHGCEIFVYYFVRHNIWYKFTDLPKLMQVLQERYENKGFILIKNKGWRTAGWTVPRESLKDLYEMYEFVKKDA